jgi:hypothetical protein
MSAGIMVRHDTEAGRYEALLEDRVVGVVVYDRRGSRAIFRSTVVEPEFRGRGVGADLVRAALDDVQASGLSLTSYCSFVTDFIAANPGYAGLLDAD